MNGEPPTKSFSMRPKRVDTYCPSWIRQEVASSCLAGAGSLPIVAALNKRHLKELPPTSREAIVKMYLVDHVFQKDIAEYYKISPALVSRLVKEAEEDPKKNWELQRR